MRYGMVIDTQACFGCNTCVVKCKQSNNLPNGVLWNRIYTDGGEGPDAMAGEFPNCRLTFYPVACQHCENPACANACPVGATYKDPETGIVMQDYDRCIGCRMCMAACPYEGVRSYNWEEPEYYLDYRQGDLEVAEHQAHVVEKCVMCKDRVARGLDPACIEVCPARARHFGDFDDPTSEVSQLLAAGNAAQLLPEQGTNPSIYYIL